jgi:hypothetical protein
VAVKIADYPGGNLDARNVALIEHSNENRAARAFSVAHSSLLPGMNGIGNASIWRKPIDTLLNARLTSPGNVKSFES